MGNVVILLLTVAAFGLPTSSRKMFKKCTFCRYFFDTGNSPYELLWVLNEEISSYLSEDQRITLFLDEDDLLKAELVFETYCEKTCTKNGGVVSGSDTARPSGAHYRFTSRLPESVTLFNELHKMVTVARGESSRTKAMPAEDVVALAGNASAEHKNGSSVEPAAVTVGDGSKTVENSEELSNSQIERPKAKDEEDNGDGV